MSNRKPKVIEGVEIHEGSGNVYADLGYPDAEEMLIKARLVRKISEIVRSVANREMRDRGFEGVGRRIM